MIKSIARLIAAVPLAFGFKGSSANTLPPVKLKVTPSEPARDGLHRWRGGVRCVAGRVTPLPFACVPKGWNGHVTMKAGALATVAWIEARFRREVKRTHYIRHDQGKKFWIVGPAA